MEKYAVYVLVNSTLQEVYFGISADLNQSVDELPPEITHWEFGVHAVSNAVMVEEDLEKEAAFELVRELQEKSLRNPQGKTILLNLAVSENSKWEESLLPA